MSSASSSRAASSRSGVAALRALALALVLAMAGAALAPAEAGPVVNGSHGHDNDNKGDDKGGGSNGGSLALPGNPSVINVLCAEGEPGCTDYRGATRDGTVIQAGPNPTAPSTGTGVFQPFLRLQANGDDNKIKVGGEDVVTQNGFNTDASARNANFDTKGGSDWTRSVKMREFDFGSAGYIELSLDANQLGNPSQDKNKIVIAELQIFIGPNLSNPEASRTGIDRSGYSGKTFEQSDDQLLGMPPVWTLDNGVNGDIDIILQAGICDTPGQCGSGHGDLSIFIPVRLLGIFNPDDDFVLYTEFLYANAGFEEWSFRDAPAPPLPLDNVSQAAEPATLGILAGGLLTLAAAGARRRRKP